MNVKEEKLIEEMIYRKKYILIQIFMEERKGIEREKGEGGRMKVKEEVDEDE